MRPSRLARRAALTAIVILSLAGARAVAGTGDVPAGAHVRFHVNATLSSKDSTTGQSFTFTMLDPIRRDDAVLVAAGALGRGTVVLAGHAGSGGHEGDLTLRIDDVDTVDGKVLAFDDQRIGLNGKNRKAASALLGFLPIFGMGASFIRGSESTVDTKTPVETVLNAAAVVRVATSPPPTPSPVPSPSPSQRP